MSNKNASRAISLAGIGEKLKSAREKKSLTIDQAQRQTHMHQTVLLALEDGRCDEMLTPMYVKSFLRKYSAYLGLDSNQIIKEYVSLEPGTDSAKANISIDRDEIKKSVDISGYVRFARNIIVITVCVIFAILAIKIAARLISSSHSAKNTKKPGIQKAASSVIRAKPRPFFGKSGTEPRRSASAPARVSEVKQPEKTPQKTDQTQFTIPEKEPIRLMMTVKDQVYVGVKIDGEIQFKRQLPKGTIETFTAEKILNISIARAKSVELVLNGRPLALPVSGQIKDLEITRKGFRVR